MVPLGDFLYGVSIVVYRKGFLLFLFLATRLPALVFVKVVVVVVVVLEAFLFSSGLMGPQMKQLNGFSQVRHTPSEANHQC